MACRIYLITPPAFDATGFVRDLAAALDGGDVGCVQMRLKNCDDDAVRAAAEVLRPVVQERDVAFILNDRADLAFETGCDGVHLGQDDTPPGEARALLGADAIIGVTCHGSKHLAVEAADAGADYVAFGAFFATATKQAKSRADLEVLRDWCAVTTVPAVAIGGITAENCAPLVAAGADFLAVVGAVWNHPGGPAEALRTLNAAIERADRQEPPPGVA